MWRASPHYSCTLSPNFASARFHESSRVTMNDSQLTSAPSHAKRMRRLSFAALLLCAVGSGVMVTVIPEEEESARTQWAMALCYGMLFAMWCRFDGRVRGKQLHSAGLLGMFLTTFLGLPIYCLWSRGLRGILFCLGFVGALVFSLIVGMMIAVFLGYPILA